MPGAPGAGGDRRATKGRPYGREASPRIGGRSPVAQTIGRRTPRETTPGNARRYGRGRGSAGASPRDAAKQNNGLHGEMQTVTHEKGMRKKVFAVF